MIRKWKWLILLCIPTVLIALLIWVNSRSQIPVELIGKLPDKDVKEIITVARRIMRKEILPEFSWQTIRNLPGAVKRYSTIKLFAIVPDERTQSALVVVWFHTNKFTRISLWTNDPCNGVIPTNGSGFTDDRYVPEFIMLKRGSNGWTHPDTSTIIWYD